MKTFKTLYNEEVNLFMNLNKINNPSPPQQLGLEQ